MTSQNSVRKVLFVAAILCVAAISAPKVYAQDYTSGCDYCGSYVPDFTASYTPDYTSSYSPDYSSSYTPDYTSSYTPDYTSSYTPDYTSSYTPDYTSSYTPDYTSSYTPDYTSSYYPDYTSSYYPDYTSSYTPTDVYGNTTTDYGGVGYSYQDYGNSYGGSYGYSYPSYSYPSYNYTPAPVSYSYVPQHSQQQQQQQQQQTSNSNTNTNVNTNTCTASNTCNTTVTIDHSTNNSNNTTYTNSGNTTVTPIPIAPAPVTINNTNVNTSPVTPIFQTPVSYPVQYVFQNAPTCSITLSNNYGGASTLTWYSSGATSAYISPNIGNVAVSGSMTVYPGPGMVYTLGVSGQGGSNSCQTTAGYLPPAPAPYVAPSSYVTLSQIPYTGFDFGFLGDTAYWLALLAFAAAGAYLIVYYLPRFTLAQAGRGATAQIARRSAASATVAAQTLAQKPAKAVETVIAPIARKIDEFAANFANLPVFEKKTTSDSMILKESKDGDVPRIIITRG